MPKNKKEKTEERLRRKIKKYEEKLKRKQRRSPSSRESEQESATTPPTPPPAPSSPLEEDVLIVSEDENVQVGGSCPVVSEIATENKENEDHVLDVEILNLLGDAPNEEKYGPPIHKELATRWANIVKNGLTKEKRVELNKMYLPPDNCKCIDSPKLNPEAKAAVTEATVKRDKAIASKQNQIGSALTCLGRAFAELSKNKDNLSTISKLKDAAQLLCDIQFQENTTRRNFIIQGLDQSTKDAVKDTEVDQWLFGESFSEKLKACKAIKKSGLEISINKKKQTKPVQGHLNYKGPVNASRGRPFQSGPHRFHPTSNQNYKKPSASTQPVKPQSSLNKPPPKRN